MTSPVEIIEAHMLVGASVDVPLCACGAEWEPAHVAAALEEARRIETVEQLEALPDEALIHDAFTRAVSKVDGCWYPLEGYSALKRDFGIDMGDIPLPAVLLWQPNESPIEPKLGDGQPSASEEG